MGTITAKMAVGPLGFTDYIIVITRKVSEPSIEVDRQVFGPAPSSLNLVIPGLDPATYFVDFRDSADGIDIGTLISTFTLDAQSNQIISEKRWYTVGGSGDYDPIDGANAISDPYFEGKEISGVFKEGFRFLEPITEFELDVYDLNILNGVTLSTGEKVSVDIVYKDALPVNETLQGNGLYTGSIDVEDATYTLLAADRNKRVRCVGLASTQAITFPALSALSVGDGYYIDNSVGGVAVQVKLLMYGFDRIKYNGFDLSLNEFAEFWVSRGEHILIRKQDGDYWEVITDYKGVHVGEIVTTSLKSQPGIIPEDGRLLDGDEYPRLWWWVSNILPSSHVVTDDTVTSGGYTHVASKVGMFVKHSTLKKFRMPKTVGMMHKGLADFNTYGTDTANRPIDYPGGYQAEMLKAHRHFTFTNESGTSTTSINNVTAPKYQNETSGSGDFKYTIVGSGTEPTIGRTSESGGVQNRVDNIGVIFGRRI